jgi:hypothetical protein
MSKNKKITRTKEKKTGIEQEVMSKVTFGKIRMKPKWYFVLGTLLSMAGLVSFSIVSVFSVNIMLFLLRQHGPMGQWRLETMINSFPWWIVVLAIGCIGAGIWFLKKYDFSYRKNFWVICLGFIASIVISGFIIDQTGLNDIWAKKGMMRRFYRQNENQENIKQYKPGQGKLQNGRNNGYSNNI